ncbi:hypothetical protein AAHA92_06809 [Salvia divinorum]|uniref:Uncharacterized protein n=1 Tax=Salvia divinorum TaxID=28513 RepID=A0ABD1I6Z9_SALDI
MEDNLNTMAGAGSSDKLSDKERMPIEENGYLDSCCLVLEQREAFCYVLYGSVWYLSGVCPGIYSRPSSYLVAYL